MAAKPHRNTRLTFEVPPDVRRRLDALSQEEQRPLGNLIRRIITKHVEQHETGGRRPAERVAGTAPGAKPSAIIAILLGEHENGAE
jgi:hypothetical protein